MRQVDAGHVGVCRCDAGLAERVQDRSTAIKDQEDRAFMFQPTRSRFRASGACATASRTYWLDNLNLLLSCMTSEKLLAARTPGCRLLVGALASKPADHSPDPAHDMHTKKCFFCPATWSATALHRGTLPLVGFQARTSCAEGLNLPVPLHASALRRFRLGASRCRCLLRSS